MDSKSVSNKRRYDLISEKMRELLPTFPFVPTKPRTGCIPIAAANAEQVRRNNTPPFDFDLNLPALPDQEHQQEQNLFGLCWHQIDQFVIMAPPPLLLMNVPSSQSQSLLPIKKRKMPSQTPEPETKMINKKTRTIKKLRDIGPILTMPTTIRERIEAMGGHDIVLVIQKILTDTDLNKNHGRLSLPPHKLNNQYFLTTEEKVLLDRNNEENNKKKNGINVRMFDEHFNESSMRFKNWKIGSQQTFCLMTYWNSFVRETQLEADDEIQLWSFRINQNADEVVPPNNHSNLCFILIKIPKIAQLED